MQKTLNNCFWQKELNIEREKSDYSKRAATLKIEKIIGFNKFNLI